MKVRVHRAEALVHQFEDLKTRVAARAHELFEHRGGIVGHALDDWIRAEREVAWRPPLELAETPETVVARLALPGIDPGTLEVRVSPETLVVAAPQPAPSEPGTTVHVSEFPTGRVARDVAWPSPVDPDSARADYARGVLTVTARRRSPRTTTLTVRSGEPGAPERADTEC